MLSDLIKIAPDFIKLVGLAGFLLFLSLWVIFLFYREIQKVKRRELERLEKEVIHFKEASGSCELAKAELIKQLNFSKDRCKQLDFRLERSLEREQVLSEFLEKMRNDQIISGR